MNMPKARKMLSDWDAMESIAGWKSKKRGKELEIDVYLGMMLN